MTDVRANLDAMMDNASRALVAMDYLECERLCVQAQVMARDAEEWTYYARIALPLQESRRQRRMIAAEGTIRVGTSDLKDAPINWLERVTPGCLVVTPPHTPEQAAQLHQMAHQRRLHVEVLYARPGESSWRLATFTGRAAECDVPSPPHECLHRWLSDPADARRQDAADWFIDATEALGDAMIAGITEPEGTRSRIAALEACLDALPDHEKLHQRLTDAARAMRPNADVPTTAAPPRPVAPPTPTPPRISPRLSIGKIFRMILLFLVVFTGLLGVGAYWMWSRVPGHWTTQQTKNQTYTPAQRDQMAEALQARVINMLTRVDGPAERTIEATVDEINAWLAERARPWLANQNISVPNEIGQIAFAVHHEQPVIAFELTTAEISQIISLYGRLELQDENNAHFRVERVLGGELPIPVGMLTGHVNKSIPEHYVKDLEQVIQGVQGINFVPLFDLDPDRSWRLLKLELSPDTVTATVRVEPRT